MILLENISVHNGWAMAATGAIIVMVGLTVLAIVISQLHRIIAFFDKRRDESTPLIPASKTPPIGTQPDLLNNPMAAASVYRSLSADLGEKFKLSKLYERIKQENNAHPHLTIRSLRESGYLVKVEDDLFAWKVE